MGDDKEEMGELEPRVEDVFDAIHLFCMNAYMNLFVSSVELIMVENTCGKLSEFIISRKLQSNTGS